MIKLGILSSTRGTDVQAIIDAINSKKINAAISVVISNKKDAFALERAKRHGITAVFIDASNKDRECYDKEAAKELDKSNVDLILLIGYMRSLSPWFVRKYKDKIINNAFPYNPRIMLKNTTNIPNNSFLSFHQIACCGNC